MTCALGHDRHDTLIVDIDLANQYAPDFATIPPHRQHKFQLEVFDYHKYTSPLAGFCPGREASHAGLIEQKMWESWETRLALEVLATAPKGRVLDFGANVGWYSTLAMLEGHKVSAWEADLETAKTLRRNLLRLDDSFGAFDVYSQFVDSAYVLPDLHDVVLLKSDVEGFEPEVMEACEALVLDRSVQYLLLEVSPCFTPGYDTMLEKVVGNGYDLFLVPNKGCAYADDFCNDPLAAIAYSRIKENDISAFVSGIRQENVFLRRQGG